MDSSKIWEFFHHNFLTQMETNISEPEKSNNPYAPLVDQIDFKR